MNHYRFLVKLFWENDTIEVTISAATKFCAERDLRAYIMDEFHDCVKELTLLSVNDIPATSNTEIYKEDKEMMNNTTTNANVNATAVEKEEAKMTNITKNVPERKTTVQILTEVAANGTKFEYIAIDGVKIGTLGYTSEADKKAALAFIQNIVDNSDKTGYALYNEIMQAAMTGAAMTMAGIEPKDSEEYMLHNIPVILNYKEKKLYRGVNKELVEIANLEDMAQYKLPNEVIKTILMERAEAWYQNRPKYVAPAYTYDEDDDEYDEEDYDEAYDEGYDDGYSAGYNDKAKEDAESKTTPVVIGMVTMKK